MCVCVCVFNDLESPILDLSRNAFRTRFFKYIIYIFFFLISKQRVLFFCGCRVYSVVVDEFI